MERPVTLILGDINLSYEVIARKWRPKDFSQLVGQTHVSQTLLNALKNERLHHALLFTGPRGTGKTSSARILAKALRCPEAKNFVPCDKCNECKDISQGRSVSVMEIDGASNNGVESIRELRESVNYMPSFGKYKVYIIDEVHMLSTSAFNALLKTLEEPPDHVIFIMATTEVQKIPNTILSRCQRFDFRRIPVKLIIKQLLMICEADEIKVSEEAIWMIARQGDGSLRDSQSLLDQVITFSGKDISLEKVVDVLGLTDRVLLTEILEALVHRDQRKILNILSKMSVSGVDSKIFVKDLLEELRNFLMVKVCGSKSDQAVDLPQSEIEHLKNLSESLSEEDIHLLFDMTLKGAGDIARSENAQVVLEMLLLRMSQAPRIENLMALGTGQFSQSGGAGNSGYKKPETKQPAMTSQKQSFQSKAPESNGLQKGNRSQGHSLKNINFENKKSFVKKPVNSIENRDSQSSVNKFVKPNEPLRVEIPKAAAVDQTSAKEAPMPDASAPVEERWHALVEKIKNINGLIGAQLENTFVQSIENHKIHIIVPGKVKFLFKRIGDEDFQKKLLNYVTTFWGPGYSLEIQMGHEKPVDSLTPKQSLEVKAKEKAQEERESVENHPMVKQAQEYFKTEIQSIKDIKETPNEG